jgi:hypothetical protein
MKKYMEMSYDSFLNQNEEYEFVFRLRKTPENFYKLWAAKSSIRESLRDWLISTDVQSKGAELIANACGELIENVIKYSSPNFFSFIYNLVQGDIVTIETFNLSASEQSVFVRDYIEKITKSGISVAELYAKKIIGMQETDHYSLGLLKVLTETGGQLRYIDEERSDLVHIRLDINTNEIPGVRKRVT